MKIAAMSSFYIRYVAAIDRYVVVIAVMNRYEWPGR